MASKAELIEICKELEILYEGLNREEMKDAIRNYADKRLNKKFYVSADNLSEALKKFLTEEYDYVILDKDDNILDHMGNIKGE